MNVLKKPAAWLERHSSLSKAKGIPQLGNLLRHGSFSSGESEESSYRSLHTEDPNVRDSAGESGEDHNEYGEECKWSIMNLLAAVSQEPEDRHLRHISSDSEGGEGTMSVSSGTDKMSISTPALTPPSSEEGSQLDQSEEDEEEDAMEDAQNDEITRQHHRTGKRLGNFQNVIIRDSARHKEDVASMDIIEHLDESPHALTSGRFLPNPSDENDVAGGDKVDDDVSNVSKQEADEFLQSGFSSLEFVESKVGKWPTGGEELLASIPAVLCRIVLIKGSLSITNKRLAFYAWLSPTSTGNEQDVLAESVATMHYSQKWKPKRRVYMVLTSTGVSHYASADDRYKPIGSRSLGAFQSTSRFRPL